MTPNTPLADGFSPTFISEGQKPTKLVHPECCEAYRKSAEKSGLMWVNSYHSDHLGNPVPFDLVSRFALCAQCEKPIHD